MCGSQLTLSLHPTVVDSPHELEVFARMVPGHDAWTRGDEPCVLVDWQGSADCAKR